MDDDLAEWPGISHLRNATCDHRGAYARLQGALRAEFGKFASAMNENGLRRVIGIGARYDDETGALCRRDMIHVRSTLDLLYRIGVPISPHMTFLPLNLEYGNDFLDGAPECDLLISCYVYNPDGGFPLESEGFLASSSRHREPGIWHAAAMSSMARVIAVFGDGNPGGQEIGVPHFYAGPYRPWTSHEYYAPYLLFHEGYAREQGIDIMPRRERPERVLFHPNKAMKDDSDACCLSI